MTSGVFRRNYQSGIIGYGTIAEAKIWRRSLRRDLAYEGGDGRECLQTTVFAVLAKKWPIMGVGTGDPSIQVGLYKD